MPQRHGRSAPERAGSLYHRVLVLPTDCYQYSTTRETFNDVQGRRDIVPSWCSDHDGIGLVPFGRDQPILERKVRTEVDNCQSLAACRSGEGENPELVARPSGQARQH